MGKCKTWNNKYIQYNNQLENIEKNKIIEKKIADIENNISVIVNEIKTLSAELNTKNSDILIKENEKQNLLDKIKLWKLQVKQEELFKEYSKVISRDGVPTYLLKQSVNIINSELQNYLTEVDFDVYFDEQLKLKLSPKKGNKSEYAINAIESSGKERTFAAISLKMALRSINNKPKTDFIIL